MKYLLCAILFSFPILNSYASISPFSGPETSTKTAGVLAGLFESEESTIKGVVLVGSKGDLLSSKQLEKVKVLSVSGVKLPGHRWPLRSELKRQVLGSPIDADSIALIKEIIYSYYLRNGRPFIELIIPEQAISFGIIQVLVVESRMGNLEVEGNKWISTKSVKRSIRTKPGQRININRMAKDVNMLDRNPFVHADTIYSPGDNPKKTDVTIHVDDRFPLRLYGGMDNNGIETTGRNRIFSGLMFNLGWRNTITYQYTAHPDGFKNFQAHTLDYQCLFPWQHVLHLYGGYARVQPKHIPSFVKRSNGKSEQASMRYIIPFMPHRMLNHELSWGADFKRTNNTVEFSQLFINFANNVNLTQAELGYKVDYEGESFRVISNIEVLWSPGRWISDQSNGDYNNLRPGAVNHYVYGKASLHYAKRLPAKMYLTFWGRGQVTSEPLLPSEQLGIGGWDTVRGYDERQLNMDNGFILNAEFRTPSWRIISKKTSRNKDGFQLLLFLDYGFGRNEKHIPGEPNSNFLIGAGPGARYTFDPYLTARYDWGFKWHSRPIFTGGGSVHYFSVSLAI